MKSPIALILLCTALSVCAGEPQPGAVVASKQVQMAERSVTVEKIAPPVLVRVAPPAAPEPKPLTAAQVLREAKKQDRIEIIATVYDTQPVFTRLNVRRDDVEVAYVSNVDFRDLTQVGSFESKDTVYDWFPWVYDGGSEDVSYPVGLRTDAPAFLPVAGATEHANQVLTLIHTYYAANKLKLVEDRLQREALSAVQAEELKKNPPHKQPVTLRFWELPAAQQK
jgi:hypothetical protein